MKKIIEILQMLIRGVVALVVLMMIYMVFALFDYQGGIDGMVGILIFQPLMGLVISILTLLICFIVGLPIRFFSTVKNWWQKNYFIPIVGGLLGICVLMFYLFFVKPETNTNIFPLLFSWFLTAFSILHIYPLSILKNDRK